MSTMRAIRSMKSCIWKKIEFHVLLLLFAAYQGATSFTLRHEGGPVVVTSVYFEPGKIAADLVWPRRVNGLFH